MYTKKENQIWINIFGLKLNLQKMTPTWQYLDCHLCFVLRFTGYHLTQRQQKQSNLGLIKKCMCFKKFGAGVKMFKLWLELKLVSNWPEIKTGTSISKFVCNNWSFKISSCLNALILAFKGLLPSETKYKKQM